MSENKGTFWLYFRLLFIKVSRYPAYVIRKSLFSQTYMTNILRYTQVAKTKRSVSSSKMRFVDSLFNEAIILLNLAEYRPTASLANYQAMSQDRRPL